MFVCLFAFLTEILLNSFANKLWPLRDQKLECFLYQPNKWI